MINRCPGKDQKDIKPEDVITMHCPNCGTIVEIWPDEQRTKCPNCKWWVYKDGESTPNCIDWCKYAEECFGKERYKEVQNQRKKVPIKTGLFTLRDGKISSRRICR